MRFTWKSMGVLGNAYDGTCTDQSQAARVVKRVDGWHVNVRCGITQSSRESGPFQDVEQAKRWAQRAADDLRAHDGHVSDDKDDKIVYLVVTQPGGIDGRDHTAKGGDVALATFDKAEALAKIGNGSWYRLETKVVDVVAARREVLNRLSPLDRLLLKTPEALGSLGIGRDLFEGNRG